MNRFEDQQTLDRIRDVVAARIEPFGWTVCGVDHFDCGHQIGVAIQTGDRRFAVRTKAENFPTDKAAGDEIADSLIDVVISRLSSDVRNYETILKSQKHGH